ncbi:putative dockerin type 1 protein [Venturia nashicola]|nr:putative dockerin type 1 protein [Venturia nashicola]
MRIALGSLLAAFAVIASAVPIQDDANTASPVCDVNNQVWSTGSMFKFAPVSRITDEAMVSLQDIDLKHGTPKSTPKTFEGNPTIRSPGGTGGTFKESDHFRVYGATSGGQAEKTLGMLEASYDCFVNDMKWRTSGLSYNAKNDDGYFGPFYKENIFGKAELGGASGVMHTDMKAGLSYVEVVTQDLATPRVTIHEYGHALTYHEKGWVEQWRTGVWWEPVANWFADTYMTSDLCAAARKRGKQPTGETIIRLDVVISRSHQTLVDGTPGSGNYYESWPFITYFTNNPDKIDGLGQFALRNMFRIFKKGSDETPLHALSLITKTPVRDIVGKYWARMAFMDIGHVQAKAMFEKSRALLNYASLERSGGSYKPKAARMPKYFGANIIPLKIEGGSVGVKITAAKAFVATLSINTADGVKYVECPGGACKATVGAGEEVMLTVVNAPKDLALYDAFKFTGAVAEGLNYELKLTGAKPRSL